MRNGFGVGNGGRFVLAMQVVLGLLHGFATVAMAGTLNIARPGSGFGVVASDVGLINCGSVCTDNYTAGASVTLTAPVRHFTWIFAGQPAP